MKRSIRLKMFLTVIVVLGLTAGTALAQMGGGMMGGQGMMNQPQQQTQTQQMPYQMGPGMGYYGMGPGMMMGPCMGYGMMGGMGPGMMMSPGMMGMMHRMMGPGMMGGYGMAPGMGYGMMGYGYSKEYQKFLDETKDLRRQLNEKKFEYFEALRNPETKPETITKLQEEIFNLKKKLYEKAPFKGYGPYWGCH